MDNSTYQLSCIVPIYNVEQYLEDCIQSLMQISNISTEIILVNDGSTDSSPEIADRYSKQSPHITYL